MRSNATHPEPTSDYAAMPLLRLAQLIADQGDRSAIDEIHRRTPCHFRGSGPITITDCLNRLCEARTIREESRDGKEAAELARVLAAERFYNLPPECMGERGHGANCRVYFQAFLDHLAENSVITDDMPRSEAEQHVASKLNGLVRLQYERCFGGAIRDGHPVMSRYMWRPTKCPGRKVCVFMPTRVIREERSRWLEENIPDVDLDRAGERQRIQAIIDSRLGIPLMLPIKDFDSDALDAEKALCVPNDRSSCDMSAAAAIIDLCAKKISEGRYTRRELFDGLSRNMKELCVRIILENDITEHHSDTQLAELLGMGKVTFSRLLADLRPGLQQIFAEHPDFRDAVMAWKRAMAGRCKAGRRARNGERERWNEPQPLFPSADPGCHPVGQSEDCHRGCVTEISSLGKQPEHAEAFAQFQRFMDRVAAQYDESKAKLEAEFVDCIHVLMTELATGSFEGDEQDRAAAMEVVNSVDAWRSEFQSLCAEVRGDGVEAGRISFVLERNGQAISPQGWDGAALGGVFPGDYVLRTGTGMTLWRGELASRQLLWALAHPGEPLKLAAATDRASPPTTFAADLLDGEGKLLVYAGIESGTVQVEFGESQ